MAPGLQQARVADVFSLLGEGWRLRLLVARADAAGPRVTHPGPHHAGGYAKPMPAPERPQL